MPPPSPASAAIPGGGCEGMGRSETRCPRVASSPLCPPRVATRSPMHGAAPRGALGMRQHQRRAGMMGGGGHAAAGTPGQGVQTPPVDGAEVPPLPSRMLPAIAMLAEHRFMASGGEGRGRGGGKQAPCLSPARGAVSPCTLRPRSSPCPLQPLGAPVPTATHPTASPCQASQPRSCCCRHGDPAQHPRAGDKPGAALRSASLINQC